MQRLDTTPRLWAMRWHVVVVLAWIAVTAVALWLEPSPSGYGTHTQLGLPPCPSRMLLGVRCFGCGLTTSFAWTVRGGFAAAFRAHALGPLMYGMFTAGAALAAAAIARGRRFQMQMVWFDRIMLGLIAALVVYGSLRMAEFLP